MPLSMYARNVHMSPRWASAGAETKALEPTQQEIAGVMQKRNELAAALRQTGLPPIEQDQRVCERCSHLVARQRFCNVASLTVAML
jgi:hypothetical protein